MRWVPLFLGSYLLGSIAFSLVVVWLLQRADVRTLGSGNAGATNVLRTAGRWPALLVLLLDIGKGIVPVRVARALEAPPEIVAGAAFAAMLGHVFPVYFGFRGGKGVATGFGALVSLFPLAGGLALLAFLAVVVASRYVSLGSLVAALAVPPAAWMFARLGWAAPVTRVELAIACACSLLVVSKHRSNLRRLLAGGERRLGGGRRER